MYKIKNSLFLLLILLSLQVTAKKGNDSLFVPHQNILKTRILPPIIGTILFKAPGVQKLIGFNYERLIRKKRTFTISPDISMYRMEYNGSYMQYKGIDVYFTYRFYPFNKNEKYPQGFHMGPGIVLNTAMYQYGGYQSYFDNKTFTTKYTSVVSGYMDYKSISTGIGGSLGWQYFIGKRKRFTLEIALSGYVGKRFMQYEKSKSVSHGFYYAIIPGFYLGYSFGKIKNKSMDNEET